MPAWIQIMSLGVVALASLYFMGLATLAVAAPARASQFLRAFAKSAQLHFVEMAARIVVGTALVIASPRMLFSHAVAAFGMILLATSVVLSCIPWRWHRAFAERMVPLFSQYIGLVGVVSFLIGGFLVAAGIGGAV